MTMSAKRRRAHDKLAALPGVRPVRRPVTRGGEQLFDLYYVRVGRKSAHPVVVIPGGPGLASVAPYRAFPEEGGRWVRGRGGEGGGATALWAGAITLGIAGPGD